MVRRELTTELRLLYKQNFINAKFNGDKSLYDKYMSEKVLQSYYAKKIIIHQKSEAGLVNI